MLKLHIDTDLGGDVDDLCALAMALNWPDVELLGVTTVAEHGGRRAGYVRYALALAGRTNITVAAGADAALNCYRSWPALPPEDRYWPAPVPPAPTPLDEALDLLERSITQGALIVGIGPFTNLALLEQRTPGSLREAQLYLMGGYVFPPRAGFPSWSNDMDYNVQVDVQSARRVLQCASPTLVPLAVTAETALRRAYLTTLRQAGPLAQLIASQVETQAKEENNEALYGRTCAGLPDDILNFQHDPLACAIALGWHDGVEIKELPVTAEIKDGWLCQKIDVGGKPTRIVTRVDGAKFNQFWLDTVVRA